MQEEGGEADQNQEEEVKEHASAMLNSASSTKGIVKSQSEEQQERDEMKRRENLMKALDDMYNELTIEHAVEHTDFSHQFADNKVMKDTDASPYQSLFNQNDSIGHKDGAYTFMNGFSLGTYEHRTLKKMDLPGINERFKMPEKATRALSERESDTNAILKFCPLDQHLGRRLVTLKAFEDLLQSENPERDYNFK